MLRHRGSIFAGLFLFALSAGAQAADVAPGLWETSAQFSMPDTPQTAGTSIPPITQTRCFRSTDVDNPEKLIPPDAACQLTTSRVEGNKVTWSMQCKGGMSGSGELTFTSNSYQGVFRTDGAGMKLTMNYSGRRIGDCR